MSELAKRCRSPLPTVHHEVNRLVASGLFVERRVGRSRVLRANPASRLVGPLTELVRLTHGPLAVISALTEKLPRDVDVFIYGSWAARYEGEAGPEPNDVDVLVVGTVDRVLIDEVASRAEAQLHRDVNVRRVSRRDWTSSVQEPFLSTLRSSPLVDVRSASMG